MNKPYNNGTGQGPAKIEIGHLISRLEDTISNNSEWLKEKKLELKQLKEEKAKMDIAKERESKLRELSTTSDDRAYITNLQAYYFQKGNWRGTAEEGNLLKHFLDDRIRELTSRVEVLRKEVSNE